MDEQIGSGSAPAGQDDNTTKTGVSAEREMLNRLCGEAVAYDCGDPKRIQHFVKVHAFAKLIAESEGVDAHTRFVLEAAAYLHDIGIHKAEDLLGDCGGKNQEKLGPDEAAPILGRCGFSETDAQRVCFLIAHHHTYAGIDGADWQILLEADMLVNLHEDGLGERAAQSALERVFKTETGKELCRQMFLEPRVVTTGE
ncbi:MAG: HD domain-containing protein [Coriobacteriales bacterium]